MQEDYAELYGVLGESLQQDIRNYDDFGVSYFSRLMRALFPVLSISIVQEVNFPDISFYQGEPNFDRMVGVTKNVIIRAGQNIWVDPQFVRNYAQAKARGMRRGVYYFYDDRVTPEVQALTLIPLIKNDHPELGVFADWEKTYGGPYGSLAHVVKFMQLVEAATGVTVGIYTGYYWFRDHSSAAANPNEYAYLKTKPLWLAWYTTNPAYVQIPAPWTSLTFWQYGTPALGSAYGVNTVSIDMNWYSGSLAQFNATYPLSGVTPPPPPPTNTDFPYDGAIHTKLRNYNSDVHVIQIQKGRIEVYQSVSSIGKATVLAMATKTGAQIAVNGGDYDPYTGDPTGLLAVNGVIKSLKEGYMPFLNVSPEGKVSIEEWNSTVTPYNAVALRRMLVRDGAISPDTSPAWYERHPKTAYGVNAAGDLLIIEVDGRTAESAGVTLFELAQLMIDAGAVRAADGGGGGDCTVVINGAVVNVPIADTTPGELRPVADAVISFGSSGGNMSYGTAKEALGKVVTVRSSPQAISGNSTADTIAPLSVINFAKIVPDLQHPGDPNYQWLQLDDLGTRFVNYFYPSSTSMTVKRFNILTMPGTTTLVPFSFTLSVDGYKPVTITGNLEKL